MHDFKKFLFETEGECLYLFWMDVERLKGRQSQFYTRKLIIRICHTYIVDGSPFQLNETLRDELVAVQKFDAPRNCWNTKQQVKELVRCQAHVLVTLQEYWCHRYALKKKEDRRSGGRLLLRKHQVTRKAGVVQKMVRPSFAKLGGTAGSTPPINEEAVVGGRNVPSLLAARTGSARKKHSSVAEKKGEENELVTSSTRKVVHVSVGAGEGESGRQPSLARQGSFDEGEKIESTFPPLRMSRSSSRASSVDKEEEKADHIRQQGSFDNGRMSWSSSRASSVKIVVHSSTGEESYSMMQRGSFDKGESTIPLSLNMTSSAQKVSRRDQKKKDVQHSSAEEDTDSMSSLKVLGKVGGKLSVAWQGSKEKVERKLISRSSSRSSSRAGSVESKRPKVQSSNTGLQSSSTGFDSSSVIGEEQKHLLSVVSRDSTSRDGPRRASHIKISPSEIPYLFSGEKNVVTQAVSNDTLAKASILSCSEPNTLLSSSTYNLFSKSSSSLLQAELSHEKSDSVLLEPFLRATIRADFTAGNPFLRYLKECRPANPMAVSYLLFWQSVENILTQDEMRRWYNVWRNVKEEKVKDEEDGRPSPYLSYFEPYLVAKNLQELCMFFLQSRSVHRVELPQDMAEGLSLLLPKGLGQGLLLAAQEYAIKVERVEY